MTFLPTRTVLALALALGTQIAAVPALAADAAGRPDTVSLVNTPKPGGIFGFWGGDVFSGQRVAARFSVPAGGDYRLAQVGLWLMNNSESQQGTVRITVQSDALDEGGAATLPSGRVLATWQAPVATYGWNPVEQFFQAGKGNAPKLLGGRNYWVVAESRSPALVNPVWNFSKSGLGWSAFSLPDGSWQPAGEGAALTLQVDAVPR